MTTRPPAHFGSTRDDGGEFSAVGGFCILEFCISEKIFFTSKSYIYREKPKNLERGQKQLKVGNVGFSVTLLLLLHKIGNAKKFIYF